MEKMKRMTLEVRLHVAMPAPKLPARSIYRQAALRLPKMVPPLSWALYATLFPRSKVLCWRLATSRGGRGEE